MPGWLPLTTRLEQAFAARAFELPAPTRTALLVAAVNDGPLLSEVLARPAGAWLTGRRLAAGRRAGPGRLARSWWTIDDSAAPVPAPADPHRHPPASEHLAAAGRARRARPCPGPASRNAPCGTGRPRSSDRTRRWPASSRRPRCGPSGAAGPSSPCRRCSARPTSATAGGEPGGCSGRPSLGSSWARHDLVQDLLAEAGPLRPGPAGASPGGLDQGQLRRRHPGRDPARRGRWPSAPTGRAPTATPIFALKLLYGAGLRCWWADPGRRRATTSPRPPRRLKVAEDDPRLLVDPGACAAPTGRGATVVDRLSRAQGRTSSPTRGQPGWPATRRWRWGPSTWPPGFSRSRRPSLRAQGRLGLLGRALALQAWSAAQLADLGAAIPAAAEARRLAQETRQPLIMATADAVQALLAALRGDERGRGRWPRRPRRSACRSARAPCSRRRSSPAASPRSAPAVPPAALEHLRRIHDPADPAYHSRSGCYTVGDLAEAALRSGEADEHRRVSCARWRAPAQQTTSPSLQAGLRYARALLADDAAGARRCSTPRCSPI